MNIFREEFSTGQVVAATGVPNATLQSWLKRDLIVGHRSGAPIAGGGTPGAHRKFSYYNVMEIAVAKALIDVGSPSVELAFKAASHFAHSGYGGGAWVGEAKPLPFRDPGMPINPNVERCKTILCVAGAASDLVAWNGKSDVYITAKHKLGNPDGFTLVEIDGIFQRVVTALGHNPWDLLKSSYPAPEAAAD